jgi:hypothetical protein
VNNLKKSAKENFYVSINESLSKLKKKIIANNIGKLKKCSLKVRDNLLNIPHYVV